jgi:hypothetical protein
MMTKAAPAKPQVGGLSLKLESHFLLSLQCFEGKQKAKKNKKNQVSLSGEH